MRRLLALVVAGAAVLTAAALSRGPRQTATANGLRIEKEGRNPWTHLRFNDDPATFHFAVVSDRTGSHRAEVFSRAVERLNLLQPAFVLSVGDLFAGYTYAKDKLT